MKMKLKKIIKSFHIKNLFNNRDVDIQFDNNVKILIGENGLGKTTVLNALYFLLTKRFTELSKIPFKTIELIFWSNKKIKFTKEELINKLEELNIANEDLMASMVMIREEVMARLDEEKKDGEIIGDFSVTKTKRVTFKTSIEQAEELGAVKKAVDTTKLKKLYDKGIKIPETNVTIYLSVRKLNQETK